MAEAEPGYLRDVLVILAAAVGIVPLVRRFGISAIVGYLVAGTLIGPYALNLVRDVAGTEVLGEFGVVFLLFSIGLELSFDRIVALRRYVFGLGVLQLLVTAGVFWLLLRLLGVGNAAAVVLAGGVSLSSTAVVLQTMRRRRELGTRAGRVAVAVLLLQDLAVVPLLTLVPLLGRDGSTLLGALGAAAVRAVVVLVAIMVAGRLLLRPVLRLVARGHTPELFTGITLLLVLGIGWTTEQAGLSMAAGAFLAGLLLSETEYRPQVEGDLEPFRGILLALFFVTVGMSIDLGLLAERLPLVIGLAGGLIAIKAVLLFALARLLRVGAPTAARVAVTLGEGGEFGFVLFGLAAATGVLAAETEQLAILVVGVTMTATPGLEGMGRWLASRMEARKQVGGEDATDAGDHVLITGFGRVGQTLARLLDSRGIEYAAVDLDPDLVEEAKGRGLPAFYGDASRGEVLRAMGIERARLAVITLDQPDDAARAVHMTRELAPDLPILVRARDVAACTELTAEGATQVIPEIVEGSLHLASVALRRLGATREETTALLEEFRRQTYERLGDVIEGRPAQDVEASLPRPAES